MHERLDQYLGMGSKMVWVIDPRRRSLLQTEGLSPQPVEALTVPGTDIWISGAEVFAELDSLSR